MRISRSALPVKAGTRTLVATFLKDTVVPEGILRRARETAFFEGVGSISVAGPYNVQGPGDDAEPRPDFPLPSGRARRGAGLAPKRSSPTSRTAPIGGRSTADDLPPLLALYRQGAESGGFEAGVRLALQKILVSPEFIFRMEFDPPNAAPGQRPPDQRRRACIAPVLLPVEQHSRRRAARGRRARRAQRPVGPGSARSGACWPIRARRRW